MLFPQRIFRLCETAADYNLQLIARISAFLFFVAYRTALLKLADESSW